MESCSYEALMHLLLVHQFLFLSVLLFLLQYPKKVNQVKENEQTVTSLTSIHDNKIKLLLPMSEMKQFLTDNYLLYIP